MRPMPLVVVMLLGSLGGAAFAQDPVEPPPLKLPMGVRVRVQPVAAPGGWVRGTLTRADAQGIGLVPESAPPLAGSELSLPRAHVAKLEMLTGTKRHWLLGLGIGLAAGLAMGASFDVDSELCKVDDNYFCSRGEAMAASGLVMGGVGAGVGALVKTDVWLPVTLDALGPPAVSGGRVRPVVHASSERVALGVSVRF